MESNSKNKPDVGSLKIAPEMKARSKKRKPIIWIISSIVLVGIILYFGMAFLERPVEVQTVVVRKQQTHQPRTVLNASGYVEPRRRATVAAKITGQVVEMLIEEGMHVKKGQVLARLDDLQARARFEASKADLDVARARISELEIGLVDAERDFSRINTLFSKNVASREEVDKAKIIMDRYRAQLSRCREEIRAAEARVRVARGDLENCTIRSPFAGIAVSKDAQVGEIVSPVSAGGGYTRTGIATIVDMSSLEIEVDVNENYISNVKVGQKAIATLDAYPDWKIPANVRTLIPTADRQKATVKVRLAFAELDPKILPDMGVKVAFMTEVTPSKSSEKALVVPKTAIRELEGKSFVFVCQGDFVERRSVRKGDVIGDNVEILAGLMDGHQVVIDGPDNLKDGQKVLIRGGVKW